MPCQRAKDREMQARPAVIDNRVKTQRNRAKLQGLDYPVAACGCVCVCSE